MKRLIAAGALACAALVPMTVSAKPPKTHTPVKAKKPAKIEKFVGVPQFIIGLDTGGPQMALVDESGKNIIAVFTPGAAISQLFDGAVLGQFETTCYGEPGPSVTIKDKTYPSFNLLSVQGVVGPATLKDPTNGKPLANVPAKGTTVYAIAAQADGDDTGRSWQSDWVTSTLTLNPVGKGKRYDVSDYDGKELIFGRALAKPIGTEFWIQPAGTPGVIKAITHN